MARKVSSPKLSALASQALRDPEATPREKSLAASVLSQDESSAGAIHEAPVAREPKPPIVNARFRLVGEA